MILGFWRLFFKEAGRTKQSLAISPVTTLLTVSTGGCECGQPVTVRACDGADSSGSSLGSCRFDTLSFTILASDPDVCVEMQGQVLWQDSNLPFDRWNHKYLHLL